MNDVVADNRVRLGTAVATRRAGDDAVFGLIVLNRDEAGTWA